MKQGKGEKENRGMGNTNKGNIGWQPHRQTNKHLDQGGAQQRQIQAFKREDDFFDIARIGADGSGSPAQDFTEGIENDQPCKQQERKLSLRSDPCCSPSRLKYNRENKRVDRQH